MRGIITAGLRIIVIYVFLRLLPNLIDTIIIMFSDSHPNLNSNPYITLGVFLVVFIILWLTWWKAGPLAAFLAGGIDENQLVINTSNTDLFKTIIRVFGMCLLLLALPTLFGHIAYYFKESRDAFSGGNGSTYLYWFVTDGSKILLGLWLTLGGRGIITTVSKIWNTARMTDNADNTEQAKSPEEDTVDQNGKDEE